LIKLKIYVTVFVEKMQKTTLAVKVNYSILNRVKKFCRERGIKYGFFVEKALEERLEREELKEDLLDLRTLRGQEKEAVPLEEYLEKRRV
jgi:hypothetical protein